MEQKGIKEIIKFLRKNYRNELSTRQYEQLRLLYKIEGYNTRLLRKLFSISISVCMYPECPYCHLPIDKVEDLSIDHIIPQSLGGTDALENLQPMHARCNLLKGSAIMADDLTTTTVTTLPVKPHKKRRFHRTQTLSGHNVEDLRHKCEQADNIRKQRYALVPRNKHR